jgi:hypothetical protein
MHFFSLILVVPVVVPVVIVVPVVDVVVFLFLFSSSFSTVSFFLLVVSRGSPSSQLRFNCSACTF